MKEVSWRHLEASGSIWRHLEPSGDIWRYLEASGSIRRHLEASGGIWSCPADSSPAPSREGLTGQPGSKSLTGQYRNPSSRAAGQS